MVSRKDVLKASATLSPKEYIKWLKQNKVMTPIQFMREQK